MLLKKIYFKVKGFSFWKTNKFAAFVKPYIGLSLHKSIFYARKTRQKFNQINSKIRYVNSAGHRIQKARRLTEQKEWEAAKKEYVKLLSKKRRHELRLEFKNEARLQASLIKRLLDVGAYKKHIADYRKQNKTAKPKIAIFSAISGGYDTLKLPEILNPHFDYILYTDTPAYSSDIYDVRSLPYFHEDTTRRARYVKTHPHQLLADYDYAIWIDANIMSTEDIYPIFEKFKDSKKAVGAIRHPLRDTLEQEAKECIKRTKEDSSLILEQLEHYKQLGFDCGDLIESNIMMFDLKHPKINTFFSTWWAEIDRYSRRDQLSLPYALKKSNISWHKIMDRPHNARNHDVFVLAPHHMRQAPLEALEQKLNTSKTKPNSGTSFFKEKDRLLSSEVLKRKSIDVIYCVHNAFEDVKICLDSVANHRDVEKLIVVDDGSTKETKEFLEDFAKQHKTWTKLIRNPSGSGYTKAANQGLKASNADFMILLNSDTIVTSNWAKKMAHAVFSTPGGGIVGSLSSAASHQSIPTIKSTGNQTAINELPKGLSPNDLNDYCEHWAYANQYVRTPLVHGFCFGVTREVINTIGYFDEKNFATGYGEENDYCFRATDAGFVLLVATNTYIYHAKSKSYTEDDRIKFMGAGNQRLKELHGKERIKRCILSVQHNPELDKIRNKTSELYKKIQL